MTTRHSMKAGEKTVTIAMCGCEPCKTEAAFAKFLSVLASGIPALMAPASAFPSAVLFNTTIDRLANGGVPDEGVSDEEAIVLRRWLAVASGEMVWPAQKATES